MSTGKAFIYWAKSHDIAINYIKLGSSYQNGYIERFNHMYRTEVLKLYLLATWKIMSITKERLTIYNTERS
ncbi:MULTISPECIES: integrase core domain-containing protein [Snodgrassella]|uniref:integrase core domain-containing protein n=1 Tax=Snodgrassella TaxID=1193515 RepID=UPI00159EF5AA